MSVSPCSLPELGWTDHYERQLIAEDRERAVPARIVSTHRGHIVAFTGQEEHLLLIAEKGLMSFGEQPTVGDWVLLDRETLLPVRLLERGTVFKRMASGTEVRVQPIAANVDTLFIVTSCNRDFNLNRIERYLCLALEAEVEPVVVITKADLCGDPDRYRREAESLMNGLAVRVINAKDKEGVEILRDWFEVGKTVAMLGSSGVGKTTILNTIHGEDLSRSGEVRFGDDRGRHTTTTRSLHRLAGGALLVDMPGIRELQLHDSEDGLSRVFSDVEEAVALCRFSDCRHDREPGCAVREAVESGAMSQRHVENYFKLLQELEESEENLRKRRNREHRVVRNVKAAKRGKSRRR
ncbi:ribosome small subunit-dependent GTPase A [Salidesulfovibrio brasiliensis]|uniref:ribosome small subunit-dependent GTPase A n=1 Tax=Salidesulfovibrio brasiliensis TaxID=221711 RepID=UPI000B0F411C|nr:ribosome small subunit-dependent GTPase A [Salidesulfovibrio brasiliensis]